MSRDVIDIFGSLRDKSHGRAGSALSKASIQFTAPDIKFDGSDAAEMVIAGNVAKVITELIRTNLLAGRDPSGRPLPAPDADTMVRREYRDEQAARGGKAAPQFTRGHKKARSNFRKRFRAPRLGMFDPRNPPVEGKFGIESGMLAKSAVAAPERDGTWRVYFAGPRANKQDGESAVDRVFKRIAPWSRQGMRQPAMQDALRASVGDLMRVRGRKAIGSVFNELRRLSGNTQSLANELEAAAEAESGI